MALEIKCYICSEHLDQPGALVFDPPDVIDQCFKMHICKTCWSFLLSHILKIKESDVQL